MIDVLATGRPLGPRLLDLASATGALSQRQIRLVGGMLVELERLEARHAALELILATLDPDGDQSTWELAQRLECLLHRLQGIAGRRIAAGHREPSPLEAAMLDLLAQGGPTCARKLWEELRESRRRPLHGSSARACILFLENSGS